MHYLVLGLFSLVTIFCFMSGIYILYLNHNERLNKIVFFICSALTCCLYGIQRSLTASDIYEAINWRRFSEVGSLMLFALLLDFILSVTIKEIIQKNIWLQISIYIPTIILVYVMSISSKMSSQIYHYKLTSLGWVSMPGKSFWIITCNIYVFLSLFIGFGFLVYWKYKNIKNKNNLLKQSDALLVAFVISMLMLLVSQLLFHFAKNVYVHELTPLIVPIPMIFIFRAMINYQFMQEREEDIIMERFRTKIIKLLSVAYIVGGFIYFDTQFIRVGILNWIEILTFSLVLGFFGVLIYITKKFCKKQSISTMIYSILMTITVPVVTLKFMNNGAITVWTFPFIIIIASVLLYDSAIFIMVTTVTIVTQLYLWIFIPSKVVSIDGTDYFGRILIFGATAILVGYINKVYVKRIKELSNNIKEQDLLLQVSSSIMEFNCYNKQEKLLEIMEMIGTYWKAERVYIYQKALDDDSIEPEYFVWYNETRIQIRVPGELEIFESPWWKSQIREYGVIKFEDVNQLPANANNEKEVFLKQTTESVIAVPITGYSLNCGFLRMDFSKDNFPYSDNMGKILHTIGNILGKSEDKNKAEVDMENMAYYDQLTRIPNRHLFEKYVDQWIMNSKRINSAFCVFFLDIDSFKNINDISGHGFGDSVLVKVAEKIESCLRKTDILCRFGGDEFLILIQNDKLKDNVEKLAHKILIQFQNPIIIDENELNLTLSIGISSYPKDGTDKDTLIKNADIAMYSAKSNGKNCFVFCSEKMKAEISKEMTLTNLLYKALDKNEFELVYQPQVNSDSLEIVATEALIRWNNPIVGTISPSVFIPIAEKNGLINGIGEWVLLEACRQNKKWQDAGYPKIGIAVNISANQLLMEDFPEKVRKTLDKVKLDPKYLEIEITEGVAMQKSEFIIKSLSRLRKLGISIAIDDFGVEYSSLNRIKDLPIDKIKLDIEFIKNILVNEKERKITDSIIELAKKLNLKVIAEGVEEKDQYLYLKQRKCDEIQGYYFFRPLSVDKIENIFKGLKKE